ncbi:unnamed protein product [Caenorhabditis nigoni]
MPESFTVMETTSNQTIYRPIPIYGVSPVGMTPQGMASSIVPIGGDESTAFKPYCAPKVTSTVTFIAMVASKNNTIYGLLPVGRTQGMTSKIVRIGGDGPSAFKPYCAPDKKKGEPLSVGWDTRIMVGGASSSSSSSEATVPEPLDPTSPKYQDRLVEAKKNASSSAVYQDDKILLCSSLFNPDLDVVKSSADSANLFSTWFMKKEGVDRVASRVAWSRIVSERGEEWREWTTRAEELKNEHKKQLMCGYVKLAPTKNRKRKVEVPSPI